MHFIVISTQVVYFDINWHQRKYIKIQNHSNHCMKSLLLSIYVLIWHGNILVITLKYTHSLFHYGTIAPQFYDIIITIEFEAVNFSFPLNLK